MKYDPKNQTFKEFNNNYAQFSWHMVELVQLTMFGSNLHRDLARLDNIQDVCSGVVNLKNYEPNFINYF